jgi:hypothetical protein
VDDRPVDQAGGTASGATASGAGGDGGLGGAPFDTGGTVSGMAGGPTIGGSTAGDAGDASIGGQKGGGAGVGGDSDSGAGGQDEPSSGGQSTPTAGSGGADPADGGAGGCDPCDCDGDGALSADCDGDDCNDNDENVKPGQTEYFLEASPGHGFNFDCSTDIEYEHAVELSCDALACDEVTQAFIGTPPCGSEDAPWGRCVARSLLECSPTVLSYEPVRCH